MITLILSLNSDDSDLISVLIQTRRNAKQKVIKMSFDPNQMVPQMGSQMGFQWDIILVSNQIQENQPINHGNHLVVGSGGCGGRGGYRGKGGGRGKGKDSLNNIKNLNKLLLAMILTYNNVLPFLSYW